MQTRPQSLRAPESLRVANTPLLCLLFSVCGPFDKQRNRLVAVSSSRGEERGAPGREQGEGFASLVSFLFRRRGWAILLTVCCLLVFVFTDSGGSEGLDSRVAEMRRRASATRTGPNTAALHRNICLSHRLVAASLNPCPKESYVSCSVPFLLRVWSIISQGHQASERFLAKQHEEPHSGACKARAPAPLLATKLQRSRSPLRRAGLWAFQSQCVSRGSGARSARTTGRPLDM